jgi:hypothetical protein
MRFTSTHKVPGGSLFTLRYLPLVDSSARRARLPSDDLTSGQTKPHRMERKLGNIGMFDRHRNYKVCRIMMVPETHVFQLDVDCIQWMIFVFSLLSYLTPVCTVLDKTSTFSASSFRHGIQWIHPVKALSVIWQKLPQSFSRVSHTVVMELG